MCPHDDRSTRSGWQSSTPCLAHDISPLEGNETPNGPRISSVRALALAKSAGFISSRFKVELPQVGKRHLCCDVTHRSGATTIISGELAGLTRTGSEKSTSASEVDTPSPANTSNEACQSASSGFWQVFLMQTAGFSPLFGSNISPSARFTLDQCCLSWSKSGIHSSM